MAMDTNQVPFYIFSLGSLLTILLEILNPTFYEIRNSYSKLVNTPNDTNSFDLNVTIYIIIIPLIMNTVIICALGKYTHENNRSMILNYISCIHLSIMSFILTILFTCLFNLFFINSFFLTNCVQILSVILLVIFNSTAIFLVEIEDLKRINNTVSLSFSFVTANKRPFYFLVVYFFLYFFFFLYLVRRVYLNLGMGECLFCVSFSLFVCCFVFVFLKVWYKKKTVVN